jgi:hypothetical protein
MVERARACYKRKLDEDPSYKCLTRLQVGWAVAGAYPLRTPPRFVPVERETEIPLIFTRFYLVTGLINTRIAHSLYGISGIHVV